MDALIQLAKSNSLEVTHVQDHCTTHKLAPLDLLDAMAERVATRYLTGEWSFSEADSAVNGIFHFATGTDFFALVNDEVRPLLLGIYTAFDQGEFQHQGDAPDVSPELKYTLPMLKETIEPRRA